MTANGSAPVSVSATEGKGRKTDQLDGSITFKDTKCAPQSQGKFAHTITRSEFAKHRGTQLSLSMTKRHPALKVRAAGKRSKAHPSPISDNAPVTLLFDWRDHLEVHPAAEAFPLLPEKELKKLAGDIKRNDLKTDFVLWQPDEKSGSVLLDGRNRLDALAILDRLALNGTELCIKRADGSLRQIKSFKAIIGGDPEEIAYSLNLHRRHLTTEQKRELIAKLLKAQPEKSNRQIAKTAKVDDKTVGIHNGRVSPAAPAPSMKAPRMKRGGAYNRAPQAERP